MWCVFLSYINPHILFPSESKLPSFFTGKTRVLPGKEIKMIAHSTAEGVNYIFISSPWVSGRGYWATDGTGLLFFQIMCTGALPSNLTWFVRVSQKLIGACFKNVSPSEEFKSKWVSGKEGKRFGVWPEGREIKNSFLLHFMVTWNLHCKSLPWEFAGEQFETGKAWWV